MKAEGSEQSYVRYAPQPTELLVQQYIHDLHDIHNLECM